MERELFGADNAVEDPLLRACYVDPTKVSTKPILSGRWGQGKTAIVLERNRNLSEVLKSIDPKLERSWYIGETSLRPTSLARLKKEFENDQESYHRALQSLWRAEVLRTLSMLLYTLWEYYGSPTGEHWMFVAKTGKSQEVIMPIWNRIHDVIGVVVGTHESRTKAWKDLDEGLRNIFYKKASDNLQACLEDIRGHELQPVVAIEPIDTPKSDLDEGGIAMPLINALLNEYYYTLRPKRIPLRISIPWHRYNPKLLDFPQRYREYMGRIKWDELSLRNFINQRIRYELKDVGRGIGNKDAWSVLFEREVTNEHCEGKIREDSFHYILRHTHYRARDLQRLARESVKRQASLSGTTTQKLLADRGMRVGQRAIREAVSDCCRETLVEEFIPEIERRYSDAASLVNTTHGLSVPFTLDTLNRRYKKAIISTLGREPSPSEIMEAVHKLWESGIIGVEIAPKSKREVDPLLQILGRDGFRQYAAGDKKIHRWYFFEYNSDQKAPDLLRRFEDSDKADAKLVLHPKTFEDFASNVSRDCPIGA